MAVSAGPKASLQPVERRQVRVRAHDGVGLHAEVIGHGPPMLLCNGLYCSTHYWPLFVEHFAQTHTVVMFDYRGHGQSDPAPSPSETDLDTLTRDAIAVLDACVGDPAIVVGHSMGVRIALEIAVRRPANVAANVLLCGNAWMLGDAPIDRALDWLARGTLSTAARLGPLTRALRYVGTERTLFFAAASLIGGLGPGTPRAPVDQLVESVRKLDVRLMSSLGQAYFKHDARPLLPRVLQPTLQIVGSVDRVATPAHAAQIAALLRRSQTIVLPGCTHLAPVEQPVEVHRAVRAFLRSAL